MFWTSKKVSLVMTVATASIAWAEFPQVALMQLESNNVLAQVNIFIRIARSVQMSQLLLVLRKQDLTTMLVRLKSLIASQVERSMMVSH